MALAKGGGTCAAGFASAMGRLTFRPAAGTSGAWYIEGDAAHFQTSILQLNIDNVCHLTGVATEALAKPVAHVGSATRPESGRDPTVTVVNLARRTIRSPSRRGQPSR